MNSNYLRHFIRESLLEADDKSKSASDSSDSKTANSKMSPQTSSSPAKKIASQRFQNSEEFVFNSWTDICERTYERNHFHAVYEKCWQHIHTPNDASPSGAGYVLFGVQRYSPVGDILGDTLSGLFKAQIQKYQAYGHAWVMFVNHEGFSERFEFAFAKEGACEPVSRETVLKNIDEILKDTKYAASVYDNLASAIGAAFGTLIGGVVGLGGGSVPGAVLGGTMGSAIGRVTQMTIDDATKAYILREIMPTLIKNYPSQLGKVIHFNLPGYVYGETSRPEERLLTGKKFVEIVDSVVKTKGYEHVKLYQQQEDDKYYYLDFYNMDTNDPWRYKVKKTVLNANELVISTSTNQPDVPRSEAAGPPAYPPVRAGKTIGLLVMNSNDVSAGVSWCKSMKVKECDIPYTLPMPGTSLITPEITNGYNCGIFAASAANQSLSGFQFDLSTKTDIFTSPPSFFHQGETKAVDVFKGSSDSFSL